jgi:hypothetical protein
MIEWYEALDNLIEQQPKRQKAGVKPTLAGNTQAYSPTAGGNRGLSPLLLPSLCLLLVLGVSAELLTKPWVEPKESSATERKATPKLWVDLKQQSVSERN